MALVDSAHEGVYILACLSTVRVLVYLIQYLQVHVYGTVYCFSHLGANSSI